MTLLDLAVLTIILLAVALTVALLYARQEHEHARRQRILAEETWCWADEYQRRCTDLARRNAALQDLHSLRVRQLLAANYHIVAANLEWKRSRQ